MTSPIRLDGDVVVVTGAGRGLGRAYALDLGARGASVLVNDVDGEAARATAAAVEAVGGQAVPVPGSVAEPDEAQALIATAERAFGTVDVVVNNAGVVSHGYFEDLSLEQIDRVLDVDLRSAFLVTQPAWRIMKAKGYGRVILTGSGSGMFSHQGTANYAAAKAGLYGLMRALAFEGRPCGIKVNMILPMARTSIAADDPVPDYDRYRPPDPGRLSPAAMAARATVERNACVVSYLASRTCELSGEAIDVCHGRYGRLFVGVADGWADGEGAVEAEDVAAHLSRITDIAHSSVPEDLYDAMAGVAARLAEAADG